MKFSAFLFLPLFLHNNYYRYRLWCLGVWLVPGRQDIGHDCSSYYFLEVSFNTFLQVYTLYSSLNLFLWIYGLTLLDTVLHVLKILHKWFWCTSNITVAHWNHIAQIISFVHAHYTAIFCTIFFVVVLSKFVQCIGDFWCDLLKCHNITYYINTLRHRSVQVLM